VNSADLPFSCTVARWQDCRTLVLYQYPIMSNWSAKKVQDGSIRVLTGMLLMRNAADPSNLVNKMVIIVFVVYYVMLQASWWHNGLYIENI
jgi:hypothetical protein